MTTTGVRKSFAESRGAFRLARREAPQGARAGALEQKISNWLMR